MFHYFWSLGSCYGTEQVTRHVLRLMMVKRLEHQRTSLSVMQNVKHHVRDEVHYQLSALYLPLETTVVCQFGAVLRSSESGYYILTHWNSFEDRVPGDEIYGYPIFRSVEACSSVTR